MATVKRKKGEKGYSYHEYTQKFQSKSFPKEEKRPHKEPFACLPKLVLDDMEQEGTQTPPDSEDSK